MTDAMKKAIYKAQQKGIKKDKAMEKVFKSNKERN
jgi:hypothetical protein